MSAAGKWPGINDRKHVVKRVPKGTPVEHVVVGINAIRVGDKIIEKGERSDTYFTVNSKRYTRRGTVCIVNGYCVYGHSAEVRIVTQGL